MREQACYFFFEDCKIDGLFEKVGHGQPFAIDVFVTESERELLVDRRQEEDGEVAVAPAHFPGQLKTAARDLRET